MTIRLRAHHLLCILTYSGRGYSPAFEANFGRIIKKIQQGEAIELVQGPDDICQPQLSSADCHCNSDSIQQRDRAARQDLLDWVGLDSKAESIHLSDQQIRRMRTYFATGSIRSACQGCEWSELCSAVAKQKYRTSKLQLPIARQ